MTKLPAFLPIKIQKALETDTKGDSSCLFYSTHWHLYKWCKLCKCYYQNLYHREEVVSYNAYHPIQCSYYLTSTSTRWRENISVHSWQLLAPEFLNGTTLQMITLPGLFNRSECVGESIDPLPFIILMRGLGARWWDSQQSFARRYNKLRREGERQKKVCTQARSDKTVVEFPVLWYYGAWLSRPPSILFNIRGH